MKTPSFSHASPAIGRGSVGNMVGKLATSELDVGEVVGSNVTVDAVVANAVVSL